MKKGLALLTLLCLLMIFFSLSGMTVLQASAAPDAAVASSKGALLTPPPPVNPVLWLRAEGDALDSSSYHNDGNLVNGVTFTEGKFGQAFEFNQTNQVRIPSNSSLNFGSGDFSGYLWFKSYGSGYLFLVDSDLTGVGNSSWFVNINGATARFATGFGDGTGDHYVSANKIVINDYQWHFLAWVRSSDAMKIYVDGQLGGTTSVKAGNVTNNVPVAIGGEYNDVAKTMASGFKGAIDEVAFFNRALSDAEIMAQYDGPAPVPTVYASNTQRVTVSGAIEKDNLNLDIHLSPSPDLRNMRVFVVQQDGKEYLVGPATETMTWQGPPEGGIYRIEVRDGTAQGSGRVLATAGITIFPPATTPGQVAGTVAAGVAVVSVVSVAASRGFNFLDWLRRIFTSIVNNKAKEKTKHIYSWRLASWAAIILALILSVIFMAVGKSGGFNLNKFFEALIITGVASIIFSLVSIAGGVLVARIRHQECHYRLWTAGSITFALTNILLHSSLGYTGFLERKNPGKRPDRGTDARGALASMGLTTAMVAVFLAVGLAAKFAFAQTGISLALGGLGIAAIPFSTLEGHAIWKWSKPLGIVAGIVGVAVYVLFQIGFLQETALFGLGATGFLVFLSVVAYEILTARRANRKEVIMQPASSGVLNIPPGQVS